VEQIWLLEQWYTAASLLWRLWVRQPSRMSQEMRSFDVINLAATQSFLPRLVKAEIIAFEGNQTLLEKSRVVMWPEIGCLIYDVILWFRIFLGASAKLMKPTFMFVSLSSCNNYAPTGWIFMKFDIWEFRKPVYKIKVLLQSDKNIAYFTWRPIYVHLWRQMTEFFLE